MSIPGCLPIEVALASGNGSVRITAISAFSNIDFDGLASVDFTKDIHYFEPDPTTLALLQQVPEPYFFVDVQQNATLVNGVMFAVLERVYGVVVFGCQCFLESVKGSLGGSSKTPILFNNDKETVLERILTSHEHHGPRVKTKLMSLKPPTHNSKVVISKHIAAEATENDPLTFITTRYYNMLYSMTTPLSYFPKTAFTRLANICKGTIEEVVKVLTQLVISVEEFDRRHQGKYGCLHWEKDDHYFKFGAEEQAQTVFVDKIRDTIDMAQLDNLNSDPESPQAKSKVLSEEKMGKIVLDLKVREAHLQILIVLELLCLQASNEEQFLERCQKREKKEANKAQKMPKTSLVRKNKSKRKIVPTFLGMGVHIQNSSKSLQPEQTTTSIDDYALYSIISNLMERLNLWDTLRTKGSSSDSSKSFLGYVVVPYYNKKMPVVVKFLIEKIRGLSFKTKRKNDRSKPKQKELNLNESDESVTYGKGLASNKTSKYDKHLIKRPTLKQSLSGADDLRPALSLRRTKSSLTSSKNLERRQVDVSVSLKSFTETSSKTESSSNMEAPTQSFIFTKARKSLSTQAVSIPPPSYSQVEATPMRQTRVSQVLDTPLSTLMTKTDTQIILSSGSKKLSLNDRLMAASFVDDEKSSKNLQMNPPRARNTENPIDSSPITTRTAIDSSPIMTRTIINSSPASRKDIVIADSSPIRIRTGSLTKVPTIKPNQVRGSHSAGFLPCEESPSKRQKPGLPVSRTYSYSGTDTDED